MNEGHIVVIDDCRLTRTIIRDILEAAGHEVVAVESGIEANPHIYRSPPPKMLIIDVLMPMLNGDQKVRLLKGRESSRNIPVVLMSTKPEAELKALAAAAGADGYLLKPVKKEALLQMVNFLGSL
jgi:CheY-like chemotaxis protein